MNLYPRGNRVVVKRDQSESVSPGGIVLPDSSQKKSQKGTVLAVGPGKKLDTGDFVSIGLSVGDKVLFVAYAGEEFCLDGDNKVLLIREDDVIAVLEDNTKE